MTSVDIASNSVTGFAPPDTNVVMFGRAPGEFHVEFVSEGDGSWTFNMADAGLTLDAASWVEVFIHDNDGDSQSASGPAPS